MNLFSEIEGRSGEDLTSAVLRFLILRSQEVREKFRDLVSEKSNQGPIVMQAEFSCRLEVPMKSNQNGPEQQQNSGSGRIDLLIQTDNAIIGVENKLDANFQLDQPEKYRQRLEQLAQSQSNSGGLKQYALVILAPGDRHGEISERIKNYKHLAHYIQLDWEKLLDQFGESCSKNSDRISQTLIDQLKDYIIDNRRTFWPKDLSARHLQGVFNPQGVQGEFIRKLANIFPGSRIGTGKTTTGYHPDIPPHPDSTLQEIAWLGFASKNGLCGNVKYDSELILATTKSPTVQPPPPSLRSITMKTQWWGDRQMHVWAIDYDGNEDWKRPETWRNLFKFLL